HSALAAFQGFVAAGGDSGVGLLEQARALHALGKAAGAVDLYARGAAAAGEDGRRSYRRDLAWIASPAEMAAFDSLPLDSISNWLTAFWSNRDVAQLRAPGERLLEHLRRWRYVHQEFQVTGRQDAGGFVASTTECGPSGLMDAMNSETFSSDLQLYMPGVLPATKSGRRVIDDRGIVYMRHGEPDARAGGNPQSWKYNLPTGTFVFHFCGSRGLGTQAPTTLVAMLPLNLEIIDSRMGLDVRYARLAAELQDRRLNEHRMRGALAGTPTSSSLNLVSRALVNELEMDGKADIRTGLATDSYAPRFSRQL